jgi:hypothetical protein
LKRVHGIIWTIKRSIATKPSHTHATAKNTIASARRAARLTLKRFIPASFRLIPATTVVHAPVTMAIKRGEHKAFCAAIWPLISC